MNLSFLIICGALIIISCFSGALTYLNWHDRHYRIVFSSATISLLILLAICLYSLFTHLIA